MLRNLFRLRHLRVEVKPDSDFEFRVYWQEMPLFDVSDMRVGRERMVSLTITKLDGGPDITLLTDDLSEGGKALLYGSDEELQKYALGYREDNETGEVEFIFPSDDDEEDDWGAGDHELTDEEQEEDRELAADHKLWFLPVTDEGEKVYILRHSLIDLRICTNLPQDRVEDEANRKCPTGISTSWELDGDPVICDTYSTRKHYNLVC